MHIFHDDAGPLFIAAGGHTAADFNTAEGGANTTYFSFDATACARQIILAILLHLFLPKACSADTFLKP